ncbi:MAG: alanine--tRNA ligase [Planctomycetota bacterium JB042]
MRADEIRRRYLEFFQRKDHQLFPSDSLVPEGDASVLFTGAGMNQFKDAFLGKGPKDLLRACSSQKCLRMPDLDNVGRTRSHHTFFEMLGNFSFGDYFKREAITWAIEFLEGELGLKREQLAVTVYLDDDEAAEIWEKEIGFAKDRIWRYGEEDNFWPAEAPSKGPNGPCGPCSEIYFDFGPEATSLPPDRSDPAGDSDRFVEIWNLVFTQYERRDGGTLNPLPRKNIDTGAGLERLARVMQGKPNNFETDLFAPILERIGDLTGKRYGASPDDDVRMKRIADHVRAATFCISDGVRPGNEGRGYVVRKVVRRASMDLRELGLERPGLLEVVPTVVRRMGEAYPDLRERERLIRDTIGGEEERFGEVYRQGVERLEEFLEEEGEGATSLSGKKAFFLWDTIGFPFDITKRFCEERGVAVDEAEFDAAMESQRSRAREGSRIKGDIFGTGPASRLRGAVEPTEFTGYERVEGPATVVAILDEEGAAIDEAPEGAEVRCVLDRTPFYAESGGQIGDTGTGAGDGVELEITDTQKAEEFVLHVATVRRGTLKVGAALEVHVDAIRRADTMRNHTATHLMHWALRRVLGEATTQAGSLVRPDLLRFDYTAREAPTAEQLSEVEDLVNEQVLRALEVRKTETSYDAAREAGAIALFGEKYGDDVRVVRVVDEERGEAFESVELCGGTHCRNTGEIGLFKIVSDGAIAAGVRRLIALTGRGALRWAREKEAANRAVARLLKSAEDEIEPRVKSLLEERSRLEKEIQKTKRAAAASSFDEIRAAGVDLGGGTLYVHTLEGVGTEELRALSDRLVGGDGEAVVVLTGVEGGGDDRKVSIVAACTAGAVKKGVKAGDLCRSIGKALGGGGGGRPQMAQGQGKDVDRLEAALADAVEAVRAAWA